MKRPIRVEPHLPVSELNLKKTALRVLGQRLVSPEVAYIQRTLGPTATQVELDKTVAKVRKMPWASIMQPERTDPRAAGHLQSPGVVQTEDLLSAGDPRLHDPCAFDRACGVAADGGTRSSR